MPPDYHVLVVDDDNIGRTGARLLFEHRGFRVSEAQDGFQALEVIDQGDVDAVLLDIHMPGLDGVEVARRVRSNPNPAIARLPLIALTASVMAEQRQHYLNEGMNWVLAKPIDIDETQSRVEALCVEYRKHKATSTPEIASKDG